jgi:hypothetical protein
MADEFLQAVSVGDQARAKIGNDGIKKLLMRHLQSGGFEKPDQTWWRLIDQDTGAVLEVIAETRWTDVERTSLHTVCALAEEWRELTGEDPPPHVDGTMKTIGTLGPTKKESTH